MVTNAMIVTMSSGRWSIAAAKAKLSQVVERANRAPQVLENRGDPVAVVVAIADYRRLAEQDSRRAKWLAFLQLSAALGEGGGVNLEIPRRATRPESVPPPPPPLTCTSPTRTSCRSSRGAGRMRA